MKTGVDQRGRRAGGRVIPLIFCLVALAACGARAEQAVQTEDEKYRRAFDGAVDKALAYLAAAQLPDGSFPGGMPKCTAVASLCVVAFLARGYSPGLPPYGDTINRGIEFVLASQTPDGLLCGGGAGGMYSHNISTLMLAEVSGMTDPDKQKRIAEALAKGLKVTLDAQKVQKGEVNQGGWRYAANSSDSDISHSGWAQMALRAARNSGAAVPKEAIEDAVKFIMRCQCKDGGFGYSPGGDSGLARTGIGLLCLELSGRHRDETTKKAAAYILKVFEKGWANDFVFYAMYYCAHGMFQLGEDEWGTFAPKLYDAILKIQNPDGSWPMTPGGNSTEGAAGPCYRTAMAVLALSVTYQQLPIYQR